MAERRQKPSASLNLVRREKKAPSALLLLAGIAALLLLSLAVGKFAVADRFAKVREAQALLDRERAELEQLRSSLADFDEVRERYQRYTFQGYDRSLPDPLKALELAEREIQSPGRLERLSVSGRTMTLTLTGLTLEQVSALLARLEKDPLVERATVAASGREREESVVWLEVSLAERKIERGGGP